MSAADDDPNPGTTLRRGWTTGACATAATKAAFTALVTGAFPDPVSIRLPRGEEPSFALAIESLERENGGGTISASAGIVKDAGDDPDATHQALIVSTVRRGPAGSGVRFVAGAGVGTVTLPGLPIAVGEPAVNPVPRAMMTAAIDEVASVRGVPRDVVIELSVPGGEEIATHTWNPRLGIVGGISILGTTGVVVPYSCSAWIASIHRGIDVAVATGHHHVAGCTGSTSEAAVRAYHDLPETAMLDMGDFAGGTLKYLRRHPVPRLTIGGGFAKLSKLAAGHLDLHSGRSTIDLDGLADLAMELGASPELLDAVRSANTALEVLGFTSAAGLHIADEVASRARVTSLDVLDGAPVEVDVLVVDREGGVVGVSR